MPQKAWSIQVPIGTGCAELLNLWIKPWLGTKCVKCGQPRYGEVNRIEVEWDEGSDLICDFVHALGTLVVKAAIADELRERFNGFTKGRIVMPRHPKLMKPAKITKRTRKRVWLPYRGPKLCELRITKVVDLLPSSSVVIESKCEACGRLTYADFIGIEEWNGREYVPRQAGQGFFFRAADLAGADFFSPRHTGFRLCTQAAKDFMVEKGYKNVRFLEVGDIVK